MAAAFGLPVVDGLPALDEELRWGGENFAVLGALAALQLGPDAANLTGARRGADICAADLGAFDSLDEEDAPIGIGRTTNAFSFLSSDTDSESEDDSDDDNNDEDGT